MTNGGRVYLSGNACCCDEKVGLLLIKHADLRLTVILPRGEQTIADPSGLLSRVPISLLTRKRDLRLVHRDLLDELPLSRFGRQRASH